MKLHELLNKPYLVLMMRRASWCEGMFMIRFDHKLLVGDVHTYPSFDPYNPNVDDVIADDWKIIDNIPKSVRDNMMSTPCEPCEPCELSR